jgi:hypothetical protein
MMGAAATPMAVNLYTPLAVILFFTMLSTLRFSFTGTLRATDPISRIFTNGFWLYALILSGPYVLGAFYHGTISPWPPTAFYMVDQHAGFWAGLSAAFGAATADIWLLWATATTFKTFSPPEDARMIKYYYLTNVLVGGYLMARFLHVIDMGDIGVLPG